MSATIKMTTKAEVQADRTTRAYQDFLLGAKLFWTRRLYQELYALYQSRVAERSGNAPHALEQFRPKRIQSRVGVAFTGWQDAHSQHALLPEPKIQPVQVRERTHEQAASNQKRERESHLQNHEYLPHSGSRWRIRDAVGTGQAGRVRARRGQRRGDSE